MSEFMAVYYIGLFLVFSLGAAIGFAAGKWLNE